MSKKFEFEFEDRSSSNEISFEYDTDRESCGFSQPRHGPTDGGRSRQRSQSGDDPYADCKKENRIFAHEKSHFPSVANLC